MMPAINLIPARRRYARRMQARGKAWLVIALASGVGLAVGCFTLRARVPKIVVTQQERTRIEAHIVTSHQQLVSLSTSAASAEQDQTTAEILLAQPDWSLLLRTLAAKTGQRAVLREIRLKPSPVNAVLLASTISPAGTPPKPAPGATPARPIHVPGRFTLELSGLTRSQEEVSQFVTDLEKLGLFDDVKLVRTGREPFLDGVASNFNLECTLSDRGGDK